MGVRWGVMAADSGRADRAAAEGFDFVQPSAEFAAEPGEATAGGLPLEVCAVPLPAGVQVTERGFNLYVWAEHLKGALHRLADRGCRAVAWSDGRARLLPVEGEVAVRKDQVLQFLFVLCEAAEALGMTVLVEPLGPRRTNLLNSLDEVAAFLPRVGKDNLAAALSLREMEPMGETPAGLPRHRGLLRHVVLENPVPAGGGRRCPRSGDGRDYRPFVKALRDAGFDGTIALPGDADAAALAHCRKLWTP